MTTATCKLLMALLPLGLFATNAQAQEFYAVSYLSPEKDNEASPKISLTAPGLTFTEASPGKWKYEFKEKTRIFQQVEVDINGKPADYTYEELTLRLPLLSDTPMRAYVFAVKRYDTNPRIAELYSTPIAPAENGISKPESLFELLQVTGYIAQSRLGAIKTRTANVYDVQIFYTHLLIARQLARTGNLKMGQSTIKIADQLRTWLQTDDGRKLLNKSIVRGSVNVGTIVGEIDLAEAEQLRQIWLQINMKYGSHSKDSCALYNPFLTTLTQDYNVGERQMWKSRNKDYDLEGTAIEAIRLCIDKAKASAAAEGVAPDTATIEATTKAVAEAVRGGTLLGGQNPEVRKIGRSLGIKF